MKNPSLSAALLLIFVVACLGCSGSDGANGPAGPSGASAVPKAIKIFIAGSDNNANLSQIALALFGDGNVNKDTTFGQMDLNGGVPTLATLNAFDVVLAFSNSGPVPNTAAIGDVLADYVDAGGKVVLAQGAFSNGFEFQGRIMTASYSPFSAAAQANNANDRLFDTSSIATPIHSIFHGVNVNTFVYPGNLAVSAPPTQGTTTVLARYTNGHNAIAINAAETVIGMNMFPDEDETTTMRLIANAMHYITNAW